MTKSDDSARPERGQTDEPSGTRRIAPWPRHKRL